MEDITVDIRKLAYHVVKHWRLIIIFAVICAFLANLFAIYRDFNKAKNIASSASSNVLASAESNLNTAGNALSDTEREVVDKAYSTYMLYQKTYNDGLEYTQHSGVFTLNPYCVPTTTIQYMIDTNYTVTYPEIHKADKTSSIIYAISGRVNSEQTTALINEKLDLDIADQYANELFFAGQYSDYKILELKAYGTTKEQSEIIASILKEQTRNAAEDIKSTYGDFAITEVSCAYTESYNEQIRSLYQTAIDRLNNICRAMQTLTSGFTDGQKNYLQALIDYQKTLNESAEIEATVTEPVETPSIDYIHKKFILVGFVGGAFLLCLIITIYHLMKGNMITPNNLRELYGVLPLGYINAASEKKGVFSFIDQLLKTILNGEWHQFSYEESLQKSSEATKVAAQKQNISSLYLTSSSSDKFTSEIITKIKENLVDSGLNISSGESVVYSPESLSNMLKSDAVVFIEKEGASLYKDIDTEFAQANVNHLPVLGYMVIK